MIGICAASTICAVPAATHATPVYSLGGEFGGFSGSGAEGTFFGFGPDGVALEASASNGYVTDGGNARVQKFSAGVAPQFVLTYGWRVQRGGGDEFQVCSSECTFGREGGGEGQFGQVFKEDNTQPVGVAVDPSNDDAYVTDTHNDRVEYFDAGGAFAGQFDGAKTPAGSFSNPRGIGVDGAGDVYVEDTGHDAIDKFSATGAFICQITGQTLPAINECNGSGSATPDGGLSLAGAFGAGLALDSSGDVYVADTGHDVVDEFSAGGAFVRQLGAGALSEPQAVASESAGNVFVVTGGNTVDEFDPSGSKVNEFGASTVGQSYGLAASAEGGRVYVADRSKHELLVFGLFATATTGAATGIGLTHATLHGSVNPSGMPVASCRFEYGQGEAGPYEHVVACEPAPAGSGTDPVPVTAQVEGLTPDTEYHFRLVTGNAYNTSEGESLDFTTIEPVFGFQLGGAHAVGIIDSELAGEVDGTKVADSQEPDVQAGSHPLDVTTRMYVNTESDNQMPFSLSPKDYYINMPAGFAGSVARIPRCKLSEFSALQSREVPSGCPTASQVGVIRLWLSELGKIRPEALSPVYNMVPPPGAPAELAFRYLDVAETIVFQDRSDGDYGITGEIRDISEASTVAGSELTLWGVPANPAHDMERFTPANGRANAATPPGDKGGPLPADTAEVPFLTNPTRCGEVEAASVQADAWEHPGASGENGRPLPGDEHWVTAQTQTFPGGVRGCGALTFAPQLEVTPTTARTDSPAGLTIDLKVPQNEGPTDLATPALKDARVTLPAGLAISPSAANGLEGCTPAQIKLHSTAQPECPNGSQVGSVELLTPLVAETLTGQVYLSSQRQGSTFHVYLVLRGSGVLLKLEGDVEADPETGQLVATFDEDPQLLWSELKLKFYGGSGAMLATPEACGRYTTASLLEPWSHVPAAGEERGTPDATPSSSFAVGSGCASGFSPGFKAGTANPVAGAHTPFSATISREDDEQELSGLQITLPKGLVAKLAGIQECSDAQIAAAEHNAGAAEKAGSSCPVGSQVGTVQVGVGPGEHPFFVSGKTYLTGSYRGAPYGLAVVVPALAGPFDLGTVVVRAAIAIDPHTAQVTVTSDQFPRTLDGIPLKVRRVLVSMDRPDFTVNPTSCEATKVTGTLSSFDGAHDAVASPFQIGECGSLAFKPKFKVAVHAGHTRKNGEYLRVTVTPGPGQANVRSLRVTLPQALPARLSTLRLACPAKQFAENPAGCPAGSHVGTAVVHTPIFSAPLTGPAIFVSHGSAAFPDLDVVLQGNGVTVDLTGNTTIVKGVTSSNFKSVPDVPIGAFELTLTAGPHSALAATGNLCYQTTIEHGHTTRKRVRLTMPTAIGGQNGAVVEQATHVAVEGCGKAGKHHRRKRKQPVAHHAAAAGRAGLQTAQASAIG